MDRPQFLSLIDELLDLAPGTLTGEESLEALDDWNSLAVIGFMAVANEHYDVILSPKNIASCRTVNDLLNLAGS